MKKSTIASILHVVIGAALFIAPAIVLGALNVGENHFLLDLVASTISVAAACLSWSGLAFNDAEADFKAKKFRGEEQFMAWGAAVGVVYGLIIYFAA